MSDANANPSDEYPKVEGFLVLDRCVMCATPTDVCVSASDVRDLAPGAKVYPGDLVYCCEDCAPKQVA